jgi:two-component system, NtrC family, response regulator PilR
MQVTDEDVWMLAHGGFNVLIVGEGEVGHEQIARVVHRVSKRNEMPFRALDCRAPTETVRRKLFGYVSDVSNSANDVVPGLLETAEGGSVFLEEVGALELEIQGELLRVIQTSEVRPEGAKARLVSARLIAGNTHDLESDAREGRFRIALFSRLHGTMLELASLVARPETAESRPAPPRLPSWRLEPTERERILAELAACGVA